MPIEDHSAGKGYQQARKNGTNSPFQRNGFSDRCPPAVQGAPQGRALPAEMLPREITYAGIRFSLAPAGKPNAMVPQGQTVTLPNGKYNRVYLLAAAANGDQKATFRVGEKSVELMIQDWGGFIGQWDDRRWNQKELQIPPRTPPPGTPPDIAAQMLRPRTRISSFAGHPGSGRRSGRR